MSPNSAENSVNPWESSFDSNDPIPVGVDLDNYSVKFSGELETEQIAKYFGSHLQIGCVAALVLLSAGVWGAILVFGLGVLGLVPVVVAALVVLWFLWIRFVGRNHAKRLIKRRPWLLGPIHGHVSESKLTVWHNSLCFQSSIQPFMVNPKRGAICYPDMENTFPWVMVPSTCFYEDQWYELVAATREPGKAYTQNVPAAPADAWECLLDFHRSYILINRVKAIAWRPNFILFMLFLILGMWISFFRDSIGYFTVPQFIPALIFGGWIMAESCRFAFARFMIFREYSNPNRQAYRKTPLKNSPHLQWFSREQVMIADVSHWMICPVDYVEKVSVREAWISFRIGGETAVFHREGFADEASWKGACQDAWAISRRIS